MIKEHSLSIHSAVHLHQSVWPLHPNITECTGEDTGRSVYGCQRDSANAAAMTTWVGFPISYISSHIYLEGGKQSQRNYLLISTCVQGLVSVHACRWGSIIKLIKEKKLLWLDMVEYTCHPGPQEAQEAESGGSLQIQSWSREQRKAEPALALQKNQFLNNKHRGFWLQIKAQRNHS